ncbi:HdeD family acid-resistance protein [Polycladidibacter stylochi]|uniref:HdeD family acid-resistance protein n=1 Tax=Polycladidibacter stylochi TaxID=1807766 RepID=UPI00082C5E75|nr:HdeD family acid-resistance protein [Pseudovibrio stylochi]
MSASQTPETASLPHTISTALQNSWSKFLTLGILMILGGALIIAMPMASTYAVTFIIAICLVALGVLQLFHAFYVRGWKGITWQIIVGLISLAGGLFILYNPLIGTITITFIIAITFIAYGVSQILFSLKLRPHDGWGWLLWAGLISLIAGLCILYGFPSSSLFILGLLTGCSIMFNGISYLAIAMAAKSSLRAS